MDAHLQKLQDKLNAKLAEWPALPELDAQRMKEKNSLLRNSEKDSLEVPFFTEHSHEAVMPLMKRLQNRLPFM